MSKKRRRKKVKVKPPLKLLVYQNGLVVTPLYEAAALGQRRLEGPQRAITIGEPVPIVFCRRVNNVGGVLVSPGATEGRYTNNPTTNTLTANVHLVLSEGQLPQIPIKDVFQAWCRVGTWRQTYNRRAGTWTPGNFITTVSGFEKWDCPVYCGTSGSYANMTTLSFTNQFGFGLAPKDWDKQVHCFVRNGMQVTRIIDNTLGSSNNVIDLALYLIRQSSRLPEDMLDTASMLIAAQFTNANGLFYNGVFEESTNLEDWLQDISLNFLLRFSDKNGKKAFLPRLPYNNDYTIKTTAITWVFAFTEEHITPDGFEIEYIPLSERKPICAQMLWREQPDDDLGLVRTTEVRFNGEAESGPFEQYDLTQFCTSENHAVKVGTYIIARRKYVTHTVRLRVKPDAYNGTLVVGDIVRVRLRRETDVDAVTFHDYLYEVERINKSITGAVELDLVHFPVDSQNRSIIAQIVGPAVGVNYNLATGREDFSCDDTGRRTDNTGLTDEGGNLPGLPAATNFESLQNLLTESAPTGPIDNPADIGAPAPILTRTDDQRAPLPGDSLSLTDVCPGMVTDWYRQDTTTGERTLITQNQAVYILANADVGYLVIAEGRCPDPSSPTGYGTPMRAATDVDMSNSPTIACSTSLNDVDYNASNFNESNNFLVGAGVGYSIYAFGTTIDGTAFAGFLDKLPRNATVTLLYTKNQDGTANTNPVSLPIDWPDNAASDCPYVGPQASGVFSTNGDTRFDITYNVEVYNTSTCEPVSPQPPGAGSGTLVEIRSGPGVQGTGTGIQSIESATVSFPRDVCGGTTNSGAALGVKVTYNDDNVEYIGGPNISLGANEGIRGSVSITTSVDTGTASAPYTIP